MISVSEITNFPEIMDGRVKTLHPNIHAGILARKDDERILNDLNIQRIDVLIVNFYPFEDIINKKNSTFEEAIENIDIVRQQLLIASGEKVGYTQEQVEIRGHAIECRINAENSETFIPCPGTIDQFHAPGGPGVRMDTHIYNGYKVPPNYDSMIGKLISYGNNRNAAIRRMSNALNEIVIDGIDTNIELQKKLILDTEFQKGGFSINYLESKFKQ